MLVERRVPLARTQPWSALDVREGLQRFRLMSGTAILVFSPTTPAGRKRDGLGLWKYGFRSEPWKRSRSIDAVLNFIHRESQRYDRVSVERRRALRAAARLHGSKRHIGVSI